MEKKCLIIEDKIEFNHDAESIFEALGANEEKTKEVYKKVAGSYIADSLLGQTSFSQIVEKVFSDTSINLGEKIIVLMVMDNLRDKFRA